MRTFTPTTGPLVPGSPRTRGAARISAIWLIVVVVLFFAALGFAYVSNNEAAVAADDAETARAEAEQADQRLQEARAITADVSRVLGFTDDPDVNPSNVESAQEALDRLKESIPDADAADTFQDIGPVMTSAFTAKVQQIEALETRIADLEAQLAEQRSATQTVTTEKNQRISELEQQLADAQTNARDETDRLEASLADTRAERNNIDSELRDARAATDEVERELSEAEALAQTTKRTYTSRLNDIQKRAEQPDGEVLYFSGELGIAYIDLGAEDRLSEGTVFRVVSGRPGSDPARPKAFALVTNVQPERSEVRIFDLADPFVPVVQGDLLYNPIYEPKGKRYAVLAGRFSGLWNRTEIAQLLEGVGIEVQDELDINTDFLIAGSALFVDEDGEPVEDPIQVASLSVYQEALNKGVTIISIRDLQQYFRK